MSDFSHFPGHSTYTLRVRRALLCLASTASPVLIERLRTLPAAGKHPWGIDSPTSGSLSAGRPAGQGGAQ